MYIKQYQAFIPRLKPWVFSALFSYKNDISHVYEDKLPIYSMIDTADFFAGEAIYNDITDRTTQ